MPSRGSPPACRSFPRGSSSVVSDRPDRRSGRPAKWLAITIVIGIIASGPLGSGWLIGMPAPALAQGAWAQEWSAISAATGRPALALDASGQPHIVYVATSASGAGLDVIHEFRDESGWRKETISSTTGLATVYAGIAIDAAGDVHACFTDAASGKLRYAFRSRWGEWSASEIPGAGVAGSDVAIAVDAQGRPHIVCHDPSNTLLKYLRREGPTWLCEVVEGGPGAGRYCALALDSEGRPHVSYQLGHGQAMGNQGYSYSDLRYGFRDQSGWHTSAVHRAAGARAGVSTSIALDPTGRPQIVYGVIFPDSGDAAKSPHFARWDGAAWSTEEIASQGQSQQPAVAGLQAAGHIGLATGADGTAHAAFVKYGTPLALVVATRVGADGSWSIDQVQSSGNPGSTWSTAGFDLALDGDGVPHVVAVESVAGTLQALYLRRPSPTPNPAQPTGLGATLVGTSNVKLTWAGSSEGEDGFCVERRAGTGATAEWLVVALLPAGRTAHVDAGLAPGAYSYRVEAFRWAVDGSRRSAGPSSIATITVPQGLLPAPPTSLSASATLTGTVSLTWTDASGNEAGFAVERAAAGGTWQHIATVDADFTAYSDPSLPYGLYNYRVRAFSEFLGDTVYSTYSSAATVNVKDYPEPETPTGLWTTILSTTRIRLDWKDMSTDETGFRIERRKVSTDWEQIGQVSANTQAYTSSGLTEGTAYSYRVRAYKNASGSTLHSQYSETVTATPAEIAGSPAPSRLEATVVGLKVRLSWRDNATNETGYRVERRQGSGEWEAAATLEAGETTWVDTTPAVLIAYTYRLRAIRNSSGVTVYSAPSNEQTVVVGYPPTPDEPSGLSAARVSPAEVKLTWSDNSADEDGFHVERSSGTGVWERIATVGADTTVHYDTMLQTVVQHRYRIRAFRVVAGEEFWSLTDYIGVPSPDGGYIERPGTPQVTAVSANHVRVAWGDYSLSETGLLVERRGPSGRFATIATVAPDTLVYDDYGVEPGIVYSYRVRAQLVGGGQVLYSIPSAQTDIVIEPPAPPKAPAGLAAERLTDQELRIAWSDDSANETAFLIERNRDWSGFTPIATVAPDTTSYVDRNVAPGTTYIYRVRAQGLLGYAGYSPVRLTATGGVATKQSTVVKLTIGREAYSVDGVRYLLDAAPVIIEDRTLLPIRAIIEALGGTVAWDADDRRATLTLGANTVQVWIGRSEGSVNGSLKPIDPANPAVAPVILPPGRTMLPVRFVTENLGCQVGWDDALREVTLTYEGP